LPAFSTEAHATQDRTSVEQVQRSLFSPPHPTQLIERPSCHLSYLLAPFSFFRPRSHPEMAHKSQKIASASHAASTSTDQQPPLPISRPPPTSSPQMSPREASHNSTNHRSRTETPILSVIQLGSSQVQWTAVVPEPAEPLHAGASLKQRQARRSVNAPWKLFDHECPSRHAPSLSPSSSSSSKSKSKCLAGSKILAQSPLPPSPNTQKQLSLSPTTLR
jgi:hypothetical protein